MEKLKVFHGSDHEIRKPLYLGGKADKDADLFARREVNHFLAARTGAILLEGYEVPGITARFAIQNHLVYQKEGNYYERAGIQ